MDPSTSTEHKLAAIRELLPTTSSGIRLDATIGGPLPAETDQAMRELDAWRLRVGRSDPGRHDDHAQRLDEARAVVAAVLGAQVDHIALAPGIRGVVAGLAVAANLQPDDIVAVVGEPADGLEVACTAVARAFGAHVRRAGPDEPLPDGTRLVVLPHIDAATGAVLDVAAIGERARSMGARALVDGSWSIGALDMRAADLGADVLVVELDHWLLGPDGTCAAWIERAGVRETIDGLLDPLPVDRLLGVARSVGWLLMYVGLPWALDHTRRMAEALTRSLGSIPGVRLAGAAGHRSQVSVLGIDGWHATEATEELGRRCFAVVDVDERRDLLRVSTGPWLRPEEVERFAVEVGELARHTPATLPRRPTLTVLGG